MSELAKALVKAQKQFAPALKNKQNVHFKNRYADLASCIDAVLDALNDNGIFMTQVTHPAGNASVIVETVFIHESGEERSMGKIEVPVIKQDPQGFGSACTYARRYSLQAACGIAPEDDDGNAASNLAQPIRAPIPPRQISEQAQEQKLVAPPKVQQPILNHAQPIVDEALKIAKQANDPKALANKWKEKIEQAKREALEMAKGQNGKA